MGVPNSFSDESVGLQYVGSCNFAYFKGGVAFPPFLLAPIPGFQSGASGYNCNQATGKLSYLQTGAHLLIGENLYEVLEGERTRLENELSGIFKALPGQHEQLVSGSVRDHQAHLKQSTGS